MNEHPIVALARETITKYVLEGLILPVPAELTPEMKKRAGVFVSLHKDGQLRGCIGTFLATTNNVAEEVIRNAIESSTRDSRFPPVQPDELKSLEISVDILGEPESVKSAAELDAKKYGIIVKFGHKRGLLLPDLPGVDTPAEQIAISRRKAGIGEHEPVELFRFEVRRFH